MKQKRNPIKKNGSAREKLERDEFGIPANWPFYKKHTLKTISAGCYKTMFSSNESISYNGITYYSAEKFIATKGASIK